MDHSSPIPLYFQLKQLLLEEMKAGRLRPGTKLPTEKELETKYGVSRPTVRQALDELVREGLLVRRHGVGSFVAEPKLEYPLGKLTSFTEDVRRRGLEPRARLLKLVVTAVPQAIAAELDIAPGDPIIELTRLRLANDEPVGIHDVFLSPHIQLPQSILEDYFSDPCASLYALLSSRNMAVVEGYETLEATVATKAEAELLGIEPRTPLLFIKRISYAANHRPIEYSKMMYRADRYKYSVHLAL